MPQETVGFIGGGRVVRVLLGGWARANAVPGKVVAYDPDETVLNKLSQAVPDVELHSASCDDAGRQATVFLAVHPPVVPEVASAISGKLRSDAVVVSLAPKFTIQKLSQLLGGFDRIVRTIPLATAFIGEGHNPLCFSPTLPETERQRVVSLFEPLGETLVVDERKLEAYAVCVAMGPTYLWPQMVALVELAESFGLSPEEARAGVRAMVTGAVDLLTDSTLTPDEVQDLIPVQPLADDLAPLLRAYRTKLPALWEKIRA